MPNFDPHTQLALDLMHTAEAGTYKYMVDGGSGVIWTVRHNYSVANTYVYGCVRLCNTIYVHNQLY
jgi:hypothetical protein